MNLFEYFSNKVVLSQSFIGFEYPIHVPFNIKFLGGYVNENPKPDLTIKSWLDERYFK